MPPITPLFLLSPLLLSSVLLSHHLDFSLSSYSLPFIPSDTQGPSELRLGKMHLVDLAGSERVALSGAEGDTLLETQNINLSLTAIGKRSDILRYDMI